MSFDIINLHTRRLGRAGTTSLELAMIATLFFSIIFAGMDLGRYFFTQQQVRTVVSELARATMIYCSGTMAACTLPANSPMATYGTQPIASIAAAEAQAPFLAAGSITLTGAAQAAAVNGTGLRTITVSVSYPFTFTFPAFVGYNGNISASTTLTY